VTRKPYPSDISDEEWHFVAPYLTLIDEAAPQRRYSLREVFNALRWLARAGAPWRLLPNDLPPWQRVYQQFRRWDESGCFEAMVSDMRSVIRVSQGRSGQPGAVILDGRTQQSGIDLHIVKLPEARKGFVLLPRRWVVERSFGWLARFRRLSRDFERLPQVLASLHFVVFAILMLPKAAALMASGGSS
jgi:transposase